MYISKILRSSFIGNLAISSLHCLESWLIPIMIDDETAVKRFYKKRTGVDLSLDNPETFCEKLNWYKLNVRNLLMAQCADKVGVREYVISKGYGECLNEVYGVYTNVKDIDIEALPDQFVLKAAHGSHMNLIVKDKSSIKWYREKMMMNTWLHQDIAWSGREWVYKDIPKRIVAEKYLQDESGELRDYKFFCFHGKPEYLQYDIGRFSGFQYRNYYDMNQNPIPISDGTPSNYEIGLNISDEQFTKMKEIATSLSDDFQQVRIDLYVCNGKVYFGEMTFFDGGGSTVFVPDEWNYRFSEKWTITKNEHRGGNT